MSEAARMKIVVTGAGGFIGRNLMVRLAETGRFEARAVKRDTSAVDLRAALTDADAVIHLAGVNRPETEAEFTTGNVGFTEVLCRELASQKRGIPVLYASSSRASEDTPYGRSKAAAEQALFAHGKQTSSPVLIYRLPNVFGKWCQPNYNSAVATFCHNVTRALPIKINDASAPVTLVYVDDVVDCFQAVLANLPAESGYAEVAPVYQTTVGFLGDTIQGFRTRRDRFTVDTVGTGLVRALYATYVSYLDPEAFAYPLVKHEDKRGWFSEFVKTDAAGQVSVFTAHPGITRGGHYHHTKTEKFLIVQGDALFRFRHIESGATHEIRTSGVKPEVVETVPGWAHDVTNVGEGLMICCLWANEMFDPARPDTIAHKV